MAERYYLTGEQSEEIFEILERAERHAPASAENYVSNLVAELRIRIFATPILGSMGDEIEERLTGTEEGLSI